MHDSSLRLTLRGALSAAALLPTLALADPSAENCQAPAQEFAPGQVSTPDLFESRLSFSPSRDTIYWAVTAEPAPPGSDVASVILTARRVSGGWSAPSIVGFSGAYSDGDPFVSPYGERMYFNSNRPGGVLADTLLNDIWIAEPTAKGWGAPFNPGPAVNSPANELYPSADVHGNLYFASDRDRGQWDLYRSRRLANGQFAPAEKLPGKVNHASRWEFNPEISPDGRTLLFATYGRPDSYGDVDIYASHLEGAEFGKPLNLGPCVNTAAPEFHPTVLWDRNEFYFVRVRTTADFYMSPLQLP